MATQKSKKQGGFAHVLAIGAMVFVAGAVGTVGVLKFNEMQAKSRAAEQQKTVTQATEQAKMPETTPAPVPAEQQPAPTPAPTPQPAPAPAPAPTPTPAKNNATAFTAANCKNDITVYISNRNGAPAYNNLTDNTVYTTYAYGTSLEVYCSSSNGFDKGYVLYENVWLKSTDISPTKP